MRSVAIAGGGLAGLAAGAALASVGFRVGIYESRPFLGGRATSYDAGGETVDNCQHILLRCCVNLQDFYRRVAATDKIEFHREFVFIEPGGQRSRMGAGLLPAPAHFTGSFLSLKFLDTAEKLAVARGLLAIRSEYGRRADLAEITMQQWLEEKRQPPRAVERFWRQILVSAVNEEMDRMAAVYGLQVFYLGFLASSDAYEMGVPAVPLGELYSSDVWSKLGVALHLRSQVTGLRDGALQLADGEARGDYYISALPFDRVNTLCPVDVASFEHSPITGVHLWFDRPITDLPHATLLDRNIQWMFNKGAGKYIQLVISASRSMTPMGRNEVIELACKELAEFFPAVAQAKLEKAHVVKEVKATFSAKPGLKRPGPETNLPNVFLAGDWTDTGWPATMEGAVRSGYRAAEAVTQAAGAPRTFVLPDIR